MTRYLEAQPVLMDVMLAKEAIPAMAEQKRILHSGPPIAWEEMCGPVKGAIIGAMLYEGWATSQQDAEKAKSTLPLVIIITRLAQWQASSARRCRYGW